MATDLVNGLLQGVGLAYLDINREGYAAYGSMAQRGVRSQSGRLSKFGRVTVPELRGSAQFTVSSLGVAELGGTPWASVTSSAASLWALLDNKFAIRYSDTQMDEWEAAGFSANEIVTAASAEVLMKATEVAAVAAMTSTSALPGAARATIWTSASADPRDDFNTACNDIAKATGMRDRRRIGVDMSLAAWQVLSKHPALLTYHALPNIGTPTVLTEEQAAMALGVGRIRVNSVTYNTAYDGVTPAGGFIWAADEVCVYIMGDLEGFGPQPAFARFYREGRDFLPDLMRVDHGVWSLAHESQQQIVTVDANAAYLIESVLA